MDVQNLFSKPGSIILTTLLSAMVGFVFIGPAIGMLFAAPLYPGTLSEFMAAMSNPVAHPEIKISYFIVQGFTTLVGLFVVPFLITRSLKLPVGHPFTVKLLPTTAWVLTILATIAFMVVNSPIIEWNTSVHLPAALSSLEEKLRNLENYYEVVTKFFTTFNSFSEFAIAMVVIAVLPALGEEYVFRGLLQPQLHKSTGNIHAAIWISAILFSSLHMQFFGFIPRMMLGALFGYLYYWSGNLWIAIFAHFVNNGFSLLMLYLYQQGKSELDVNSTEAAPWPVVAGATVVTFILLHQFKKQVSTAAS